MPLPQCQSEMNWRILYGVHPLKNLPVNRNDDDDKNKQQKQFVNCRHTEDNLMTEQQALSLSLWKEIRHAREHIFSMSYRPCVLTSLCKGLGNPEGNFQIDLW